MNRYLLFLTVLVIATCGLIYELVAGTVASYLLGDSVTQFSTVIGVYLFAMGIGSYLSRFLDRGLARRFVELQLAVALTGGASAPALFLLFGTPGIFRLTLYGGVTVVGILVGLEIPLLLRLLKNELQFKDLVSQVLAFDYLGALAASLLFPLVLVPKLGLVRTSLLFGLVNALVALWSTWILRSQLGNVVRLRAACATVALGMVAGVVGADRLTVLAEEQIYADGVVHAQSSPYQRIVLTRGARGFSLFLNGALQFASVDEYRYHEALVHPAMTRAKEVRRVLILGGGDGLAAREVLAYPQVESITLVDLDPAVTGLARGYPELESLNGGSLNNRKLKVITMDAMRFLGESDEMFDVAILDFPDPHNFSVGKLYTTGFYALLKARLDPNGVAVIQSTSPLFARSSFWCVDATLQAAGFVTQPYHALVPSFGEWGYVLASVGPASNSVRPLPENVRFLSAETLPTLFIFPADMARVPTDVNKLNNQVLVRYYEEEWRRWN